MFTISNVVNSLFVFTGEKTHSSYQFSIHSESAWNKRRYINKYIYISTHTKHTTTHSHSHSHTHTHTQYHLTYKHTTTHSHLHIHTQYHLTYKHIHTHTRTNTRTYLHIYKFFFLSSDYVIAAINEKDMKQWIEAFKVSLDHSQYSTYT